MDITVHPVAASWLARLLPKAALEVSITLRTLRSTVRAVTLVLAFLILPLASAQVQTLGQWQTLTNTMPINPVHVALMHDGNVLVVSGSGNLPSNTNWQAGVYTPSTGSITLQPVAWDMFCNGMVILPDGRPFIVSGTLQYDPFYGIVKTSAFDPATGAFNDLQDLAHGRWYPSVTTLGDGRIMTFSGLSETGSTNTTVDIYTVGSGWSPEYTGPFTPPLYPRMHLLPNGKVFYAGSTTSSRYFDPSTETWSGVVATTNYSGNRTYGSSVLFPLMPSNNYAPKVMILGGGNPATATTELIDLSAANPTWTLGPPMSQPRIEMNATILPNGKILATGGSLNDEDKNTASLNADLYDPATNTFSSAGANAFPRLYHSNALLLPDATVLVVGGNPARGQYEPHIETYSPAYLFNADGTSATRPTITSVPQTPIGYGAQFQVQTPDTSSIASAVLMRPGVVTHAFNWEQRMVGLNFSVVNGTTLNITSPPNGNIAPPGYYLLFLFNSAGVPSVAQFVQISSNPTAAIPKGSIDSPTTNQSISTGQSIFFSGSGTEAGGTITGYSWTFPGANPTTSSLETPGNITYPTPGTYAASLTVTGSSGATDPSPPTRTIVVQGPATISSVTLSPATVTSGNPSTGTLALSAAAPAGGLTATLLSGNTEVATVQSTVTVPAGSISVTFPVVTKVVASTSAAKITASDLSSSASATINVNVPPTINSANNTTFTVGRAGSFTVTATASSPAATFSEAGALPSGVTLTSAGVLSGTPAAGAGGQYPITITAANGVSPNAAQNFTLTVDQAPSITSANSTTFTAGVAGSFTVTTGAGTYPTAALSETGTLPSTITFTDNGNGTGTLAGTVGAPNSYGITFTAQNGVSPNASQNFTLNVVAGLASRIAISVPAAATIGSAFNFTVTAYDLFGNQATGYNGTITFSSSDPGALRPANTTLTNGTGTFSATLVTPGVQTITATDTVNTGLTITSSGTAVSIPNLVVTTAADDAGLATNCTVQTTPGTGTDSACSLRDALLLAANLGSGSIGFSGTVFNASNTAAQNTITLANGTLNVPSSTMITGPTFAPGGFLTDPVTVDGNQQFTVFTVASGVTNAAISALNVSNGNASSGAGILNNGALTVSNSTFTSNSAAGLGGAIYNNMGTLTVIDSTFFNNSAASGGAIYTEEGNSTGGTLSVIASTFYGNTANSGGGGAIAADGATVTITNSTFASNSATSLGGAILGNAPTVNNSIFVGNTATTGGAINAGGLASSNYNVFGLSGDTCVNCSSNSPVYANPNLAPLGNYGGPIQTMLPLPTSAAICAGSAALIPTGVTTDQRGFPNTNTTYPGYSSTNACVDAGAVQTNYAILFTNASGGFSGIAGQAITPSPNVTVTESGQNSAGIPVTLSFSGTGTASGLGPVATVVPGGATFSALSVNAAGSSDTLTAPLQISPSITISSASANLVVTGTQASQTINFTPNPPASAVFNSSFTVAASATSGLAVTYSSSGVCTNSGATYTMTSGTGTCSVIANQAGNTDYAAAPQVTQLVTATQVPQTISFTVSSPVTFGVGPIALSATGGASGNPVTFSVSGPAVLSGSTLNINGAGTVTVTASQLGNTNYSAAAPVTQMIQVNQASQTITFTTIPAQNAATTITLAATASSGLTVALASATPTICTVSGGSAALIAVGTCRITASQAGNTNYFAAPSSSQSFTVHHASQTITFNPIPAQTAATTITLTASSSSGLPLTFASTTPTICTVEGDSAALIAKGTCAITASQAGNTEYFPATAGQAFGVSHASQTITFGPIPAQTAATTITLTATASSGLTVAFASTTPAICTVRGDSAALSAVGTCHIQASQPGNTEYFAAPSSSQSFTVHHASQTITFNPIPAQTAATTITLTASSSSGLPLTFASTTPTICTAEGDFAVLIAKGTCAITASQAGNTEYFPATAGQTFGVSHASQTITFNPIPAQPVHASLSLAATATSGLTVGFATTTPTVCTVANSTATFNAAGTCRIQATQPGNTEYFAAPTVTQNVLVSTN